MVWLSLSIVYRKGGEEEEYTADTAPAERIVRRLRDSPEKELWKVALEPDSRRAWKQVSYPGVVHVTE